MSDFYEEEISKITEWNEELVAENKELEKKNAEFVDFIKELYNTECTTSAFDYQCIIRCKINNFKHRKSNECNSKSK